jgi:16S rRNA (uracil1498-N3)-methyltransferase
MRGPGASGFRPRFFLSPALLAAADPSADPSGAQLEGLELSLDAEDSRHARTVLRLQPGDPCEVVVGAAVYAASVWALGDPVTVRVAARLEEGHAGASYRLEVGIVQAIARPGVMDYVFEKGTEVGASFFILVSASGSPNWASSPAEDRLVRWGRIVREAAKQSKQVSVPQVLYAGSVAQALGHAALLCAWSLVLDPGATSGLDRVVHERIAACHRAEATALWIGPEGGWTAEEARLFNASGLAAARLGASVLRTETAGPVAVAATRLLLGDW